MVGTEFMDYVKNMQLVTYAGVEDFADKCSFLGSVLILSLCTIIVTTKNYLLKPIACYVSTEIGGSNLMTYIENYCWVQGTIPISYSGSMPTNDEEWKKIENQKILYYQWVPFVLGLQCCLFYLPRLLWQILCYNRIGSDLENIINKSMEATRLTGKGQDDCVTNIAVTIENMIFQDQRKLTLKPSAVVSKRKITSIEQNGFCIVTTYIFIKFLYLINAIGQIFMMQAFLGFNNQKSAFGFHVLDNMYNGHDWQLTQIFPRVGYCFVKMKVLGVDHNGVTAQCALPNNMLNEKIYVFLWWWIAIVTVVTVISLVCWLIRLGLTSREADYIAKYIQLGDDVTPYDERDAYDFATKFLRRDGTFLLRMVRLNAGSWVTTKVIGMLWKKFLQRRQEKGRDELSNFLLPTVGWAGDLEKPSMNGTEDETIRKRSSAESRKEGGYSHINPPSDDPMKNITRV